MSEYDDQEPSELIRALRAPGTASELSGEAEMLTAFRAANRRRGGLVRRIGVGGTAITVVIGLSGGVAAAAYTNLLPDPVQRAAHSALGGIGVPGPSHRDVSASPKPPVAPPVSDPSSSGPTADPSSPSGPSTGPSESPGPSTGTGPSGSSDPSSSSAPSGEPSPSAAESSATAQPSSSPSATAPTASPTEPSPAPRSPKIATLSISVSAARVAEGGTVTISGAASDASGAPVAGRKVGLAVRATGSKSWRKVAVGHTGSDGSVTLSAPGLTSSGRFRLVAARAHSDAVGVVVTPPLTATYADSVITVTSSAAHAGETVSVAVRKRGVVATGVLDASGSVTFAVTPKRVKFTVVAMLPKGNGHGAAKASVAVPRIGG